MGWSGVKGEWGGGMDGKGHSGWGPHHQIFANCFLKKLFESLIYVVILVEIVVEIVVVAYKILNLFSILKESLNVLSWQQHIPFHRIYGV